jgi:tetratricopeptide (TPR) repeat protein/transcriptional regulator with XRE-family HTH domain
MATTGGQAGSAAASTGGAPFGAQLRRRRQAAGLSQAELAERSGLSIRAISNLERGRTRWPYPGSVRRLADAMALSAEAAAELAAAAGRRPPSHEAASDGAATDRAEQARIVPEAQAGVPEARPARGAENPVPRQLPAPARKFTGRTTELDLLTGLVDPAPSRSSAGALVSVIAGPAGAGKTALAVQWAHQAADGFPDGQLFVNLRGFDPSGSPVPATEAAGGFAEALGAAPERLPRSADGLFGLYRSLLAGKRVLVILDNARDAAQVRPLLPGSPACRVIVTSRSRMSGLVAVDDAAQVTLTAMGRVEARQLLAGRLGPQRAAEDGHATRRITESCGGLPLALCIAAARAAMRPDLPLAQIAAELAAARSGLDSLALAGDDAADVRAAFSWSYASLAPASRRMFRLLGLHPGPEISAEAAASLAGVPRKEAALLLADLTESSLVSTAGERFILHDLVRSYAAELAGGHDGEDGRHAAIRRMLDHYLATAAAAAGLLDDTRLPTETPAAVSGVGPEKLASRAAALAWLAREYAVLLRLIELAAAARFDEHAWQLPRTLRTLFDWRSQWSDWERTHRIAAAAAVRLGDLRAEALTHLAWSKCDTEQSRWAEGQQHLQRAYDLFRELADLPGQARVLVNLGIAMFAAGRYEEAAAWAQRAHVLYTDLGDRDGQAGSLANLGLYQVRLGAFEAGRDLLVRAREIFTDLGQRSGQALASNNIGLACQALGDYQQAIACHHTAAGLLAELGDLADQAEVLGDLADAYLAAGQQAQAIGAWQQALGIYTELRHPDAAKVRAILANREGGKSPSPA